MKKILVIILFSILGFSSFIAKAQLANHPTIKTFGLRFDDGNPFAVSTIMDSTVHVNYVIELKDTINVKKIHVKISSGSVSTGDLLSTSYLLNSAPIMDANGKYLYRRDKFTVYILTITSTQLANTKFEVATENYQGQILPFIDWKD